MSTQLWLTQGMCCAPACESGFKHGMGSDGHGGGRACISLLPPANWDALKLEGALIQTWQSVGVGGLALASK